MTATKRVLFVCTGNTCRSPMAEALFRKAVAGRDEYSVGSAGVAASRGSRASRETAEICQLNNAPLENFKSRAVNEKLLAEATHVFTMTSGHLRLLEEHFPEYADKFYLTCEFADIDGMGLGADVPDPIGMGKKAYQDVARVLSEAIPAIISYIDQTTPRQA
ncbi:MAG: low molecular weight protein arginine phosphatase [Luteolibacter sp.]